MSAQLEQAVGREPLRVQELEDEHRVEITELVDADPLVNVVVAARLHARTSLAARELGGTLLGVRDAGGRLTGAAFNGGNLLPIGGGPAEWVALAEHVGGRRRVCSSIVGRADAVGVIWDQLARVWGAPRAVRRRQPLLMIDAAVVERPAAVGLRAVRPQDLDAYLPAATAMFTEELGIAPDGHGHSRSYRRRVGALIRDGRAFAVFDRDGEVVFKADFGAVSRDTCQIQGVWVRPDLRGHGLGSAAMVGVLDHALEAAPSASLYVNDFNHAARRMYERLGMREVTTLSTVLLP